MAEHPPLLWDLADRAASREPSRDPVRERADKDRTRRQTIKRLRATSQWMTLMRVARRIPQPFTLNDLSVACHQADPENFGMKGYSHFPDNHRIHYILYGEKGVIAAGLLERIDQGLFQVAFDADSILQKLKRYNADAPG
jgi:hypothetical protein